MNILKKCRRALAALLAVGTAFVATAAWAATPLSAPTWTSQSVSGTQIKLEWSKVAEAQNYTLYLKETSAANFTQRVVYGNSTTFNGAKNKSCDFYVVANPKYNANYDKSAPPKRRPSN